MEEFNISSTSQDKSHNVSNNNHNADTKVTKDYTDWVKPDLTIDVLTYIIICIGIPLTLVAIRGVFSLVRSNHVTPVYVINLLISDLIQLCCMIVQVVKPQDRTIRIIFGCIYYFGQLASVGFMLCVSLERYLVIAWPLWYHFKQTIKISVVVSVVVWALPLVILFSSFLAVFFGVHQNIYTIIYAVFILLPLPLFIFLFIGTLRALSAASRVSLDEKRRIVAILVLVIFLYILMFLPSVIWYFTEKAMDNTLSYVSYILLKSSPLADLFLYVFLRKGAVDKLLASLCWCRMDSNGINTPTV